MKTFCLFEKRLIAEICMIALAVWLIPSVSMAAALSGNELAIAKAANDLTAAGSGSPTCSASIGDTTAANLFDNVVGPKNTGRWISAQDAYKSSPYVYATYTFASPTVVDAYSVQILDSGGYSSLGRAPKTMHFYGTNDALNENTTWTQLDVTDGGENTTWTTASEIQYFRVNKDRTAYTTYKWETTMPQDVSNGGGGFSAGGQGYIQIAELQFLDAFKSLQLYSVEIIEPVGGTITASENVVVGTDMQIVATPDAANNYVFTKWEVTGGTIEDANAATTTFTPTMDGATLKAVFTKVAAELTLTVNGGGTAEASATIVDPNASVTLTATPAAGYRFLRWIVSNGTLENLTSATTIYTPAAHATVTALFIPTDSASLTLYVSEEGNDENDGFSEATAKKTLKATLKYMNSALDGLADTEFGVIYLLKGTYKETGFELLYNIKLLGATGKPEDVIVQYPYNWGSYVNGQYTMFKMLHKDAVIANLTIYKVYGGQEAPSYSDANCHAYAVDLESGGTLSNCVVSASTTDHPYRRGAVQLRSASSRVTRCLFSDNHANAGNNSWINKDYFQASAISMKNGLVDNCVFIGNHSMTNTSYQPVVATVHMSGGTLVNCSFFENNGSLCGGVSANNANARVINTVLYKNVITENSMAHDWILYGNYRGNEACFVNCAADEEIMLGTGGIPNLDATAFKDYANGKYIPSGFGVLYNAGTTENVPEEALVLDFAGNKRKIGSCVDIGAFEGPEAGIVITIF